MYFEGVLSVVWLVGIVLVLMWFLGWVFVLEMMGWLYAY
jgi:hypothetical protein